MQLKEQQKNWIGFVSNSLWYMYIHRFDVIKFLIEKGYNIFIVGPEDKKVEAFNHPNIKLIWYAFNNKSLNPFESVRLYFELKKIYSELKPICVFHYAIKANIFGSLAARSASVPCVSVINGTGHAFVKRNLIYQVAKRLYAFALKVPKEVWFLNNEDGSFFVRHKMVHIKKVHILHGEGINTDYYQKDCFTPKEVNEVFNFIITTRLLYSKGIKVIADASKILKNKGYQFNCILLGVPDAKHPDAIPQLELDEWSREGLFHVVPFTEDVRPFLAKADCFLLPSYYNEGLPRCLMEAASMELPIITTTQKGCREAMVQNHTGFYCKTKDPVDLAEKMELMLTMPETKRIRMGKNGRQLMQKKFSIERICKEYIRVIQSVQ